MSIKEQILELAAKLDAVIEIDAGTASAEVDNSAFMANLPEGLTEEHIKSLDNYRGDFTAAATYSFGNKAVDFLAQNTQHNEVKAKFGVGNKDTFEVTTHRERSFPDPQNKGEKITKQGVTMSSYTAYSGRNVGQLKAARQSIADVAASKLK